LKRKASVLFILRLLKVGISILTLSLSAKYFGVSLERDIWLLTLNCILVLDMAIWGPLNETFRARFIFFKEEEGEVAALGKTRSLLLFINLITILLVAIIVIFPEPLAKIIAPSYKGEQLASLLFMIRIVAPTFLFNQLTQIFISVLNAYNSIYIPEIANFFSGLISLLMIVFLAPVVGILSLVYAYYLSLFLLLILLLIQLNKLNLGLYQKVGKFKWADIKPFLLFALPFFFPYFIGQIGLVIEKSITSSIGVGLVSVIDYARKFTDMPMQVLSSVFTTMLVPVLSLAFVKKNTEGFFFEFKQIYQLGFLIVMAIVAMCTACPHAFVAILYKKGNIGADVLNEISLLTMFYSWAAIAVFLYLILGIALISSKKGKTYAFYGIIAQVIMILANVFLNKMLGIYIFPLSLFLSHIIAAFFMFGKFPYKKRELAVITLKYMGILVFTASAMYLFNHYVFVFELPVNTVLLNLALLLALAVMLLFALKLDERTMVSRSYHKIISLLK